ncbi:MAG: DUF1801 domain-containing protein [Flavobacteriaceae bacterium]|jgi:hypothetical protein|nr:DUF1801 domain-containing protein [Flavobacteriaceae bacterium]
MTKAKTTYTEQNVSEFIDSYVDTEQKKIDSLALLDLFSKWSGFEPKMWGPTIIGFGIYHYKYASGHEGSAPILGFSPRKDKFSLYVFSETEKSRKALETLGKYKMGKACIYIKKLADINLEVLELLCRESIVYLKENHTYE